MSQVRQHISRRYTFGVREDLSVAELLFGKFMATIISVIFPEERFLLTNIFAHPCV